MRNEMKGEERRRWRKYREKQIEKPKRGGTIMRGLETGRRAQEEGERNTNE